MITPYVPVPETNGEEWDRLEPASALDALVELILQGEYGGIWQGEKRTKDAIELRAAALSVFQNFVQKEEIREAIVQAMTPKGPWLVRTIQSLGVRKCLPHPSETSEPGPITPLLFSLITPPSSPLHIQSVTSTHLASLLFATLLRNSSRAKALARTIIPQSSQQQQSGGNFFVPADGTPSASAPEPEEQDEPQTLMQILSEHLSLAFLARGRPDTPDPEVREWDRLIVGYLCLLAQWLWEDAAAARDFLEAGALSVVS